MSKYAELFKPSAQTAQPAAPREDGDNGRQGTEDGFGILFVDDEENVLSALKRVFLDENYRIFVTTSPSEALVLMEREKIHLVISDHRMPGMTGAQLLKEIKQKYPDTIRIMLTGHADVQSIMGAVNEGAVYKFVTKPWNDEDLRLTVSLALQQYALMRENAKLREITKKQQAKIKNYSTLFDANRGIMGEILLKANVIGREQLDRAVKQRQGDELLSETVVRLGMADDSKIIKALQGRLKMEYLDIRELAIPPAVVRFLPRELCEKNRLIPVRLDPKTVTIAMADPSDFIKCDNIAFMTGLKVQPVIARSSDILAQLKKVYGESAPEAPSAAPDIPDLEPLDEIDIVIEEEEKDVNVQDLLSSTTVPPIIRIVNSIISEAVRYGASDIHIEPKTKNTVIRYRIDGMLHSKIKIPSELHSAAVSRIKVLAKQDIAERRKPQDGRITVKLGTRIVDIRVSTMPTINGEKVVMRILDKNASVRRLDDLGVLFENLIRLRGVIRKPQGIIVSTGPTGSGKTTMLYSILNEMLSSTKNFETIEDPVEYFLEDASQVHVKEKAGLTFASALRATLRQDPDVVLVGEMRDFETADIAFKAALTGHMVLSTLHTNSAVSSITRLINMGIQPYLIASALECIIAQRLVRKICRHCSIEVQTGETAFREQVDMLGIVEGDVAGRLHKGKGCERCNNTGYLGRMGVFEVFLMNDDFRHAISASYREPDLYNMARSAGMTTLLEDGLQKVRQGMTTLEELLRVLGPRIRHERQCEKCRKMIDANFIFCPNCGGIRRNVCLQCRTRLEPDWKACPQCGTGRTN